jgi:hypothetical protein
LEFEPVIAHHVRKLRLQLRRFASTISTIKVTIIVIVVTV